MGVNGAGLSHPEWVIKTRWPSPTPFQGRIQGDNGKSNRQDMDTWRPRGRWISLKLITIPLLEDTGLGRCEVGIRGGCWKESGADLGTDQVAWRETDRP